MRLRHHPEVRGEERKRAETWGSGCWKGAQLGGRWGAEMDVNTDKVLITGSGEGALSGSRSFPGMLTNGNFLLNVNFLYKRGN